MVDTCQSSLIQVRLSLIFLNTDVIGVGFEADTTDLLQLSDKCLVKKLLSSNQLFCCSSLAF